MTLTHSVRPRWIAAALAACVALPGALSAQTTADRELGEAAELIRSFTDNGPDSIPTELLTRARGIAVIPNVFRGGFILGARRGSGVISVRMADGSWSNPAFVTLTGGSIGWQIGAESTDIVLIFANDNAIKNISTGKFTLGGEAAAVAGPLRKQASSSMTFRAEVYGYVRSRGLYAGAAFQGARLNIDEEVGATFYRGDTGTQPLGPASAGTPASVQRFLLVLDEATVSGPHPPRAEQQAAPETEARTFALPE
jgi:lipid-binding SYLF domain-containing protein